MSSCAARSTSVSSNLKAPYKCVIIIIIIIIIINFALYRVNTNKL